MEVIPTTYRGVKYKSKTEAQWAKFYSLLKEKYIYEPGEITLTCDINIFYPRERGGYRDLEKIIGSIEYWVKDLNGVFTFVPDFQLPDWKSRVCGRIKRFVEIKPSDFFEPDFKFRNEKEKNFRDFLDLSNTLACASGSNLKKWSDNGSITIDFPARAGEQCVYNEWKDQVQLTVYTGNPRSFYRYGDGRGTNGSDFDFNQAIIKSSLI